MEKCYLEDNVLEIKILPYFCIKIGDYFFPVFLWHPVFGTKFPFLYDSHGLFHGVTIKSTEWETDFYLECGLP